MITYFLSTIPMMHKRIVLSLGLALLTMQSAHAQSAGYIRTNYHQPRLPAANADLVQEQEQEPAATRDADAGTMPSPREMAPNENALQPVSEGPDATAFAASATLSRAEFTALVVEKLYSQNDLDRCYWDIASRFPPHFTLIFTDVHVNDRFAKHLCIAMRDGIIRGYGDGSFRPTKPINFAESAKIVARAYALAPYAHMDRFGPWYKGYVEALGKEGAIPHTITRVDQFMTAADSNEMLRRIAMRITSLPSRRYEDFLPKPRKAQAAAAPKPTASGGSVSSAASSAGSSVNAPSSKAKSLWNPF